MQLGPGMDTDDFQTLTNTKGNPKGWLSDSDYEEMYSDATLVINTSSNNPNLFFRFEDCFPTSLGAVELATDASEVEYVVADLTLRYTLFKVSTKS